MAADFKFQANFCLCTRTKATRHFGLWYSRRAKQNTQDKPSHTCTRSHTQQQSGRLCSNAPSNPEAHFVIDRRLSSVLPSIPDIYILNTCTLHHVQNSHFQVSSRILRPAQARGTNAQVSSVTLIFLRPIEWLSRVRSILQVFWAPSDTMVRRLFAQSLSMLWSVRWMNSPCTDFLSLECYFVTNLSIGASLAPVAYWWLSRSVGMLDGLSLIDSDR
jgi:hypothetical protein